MADRKVILDQWGDVTQVLHTADDAQFGDTFTVQTFQDLTPIVEANKLNRELQMDQRFFTGKRESLTYVAEIGVEVASKILTENWDQDRLKKWLNDPANAHFRVWEGRL